jgi:signal transduction histidine kinase
MAQRSSNIAAGKKRAGVTGATFHLNYYYYFVEVVGFVLPIGFALVAIFFPDYFQWVSGFSVRTMTIVLMLFGLCDATFFIAHELTGKDFFFNLNRYLFVGFYIFIIIITGDVNSSFIIVLIFPLVVSAVYLDKNTTRNIGIFQTILFACVIFVHPLDSLNTDLIAKQTVQTILIGTISWMMYKVVVETLSEKYEKEDNARKLAELIHVDSIKNDFLSVAQHRLRTPLSGARFALESLSEDAALAESSKPLVADVLERVKESIRIVNEMLTTAEDAAPNAVALTMEEFDLSQMVHDIVDELSFLASRDSNLVNLNLPHSLRIKADRKKVYAALSNIVDNALLYTKHGHVSVVLANEKGGAVLTVADDGIGIDPSDLPYIFDRMHRGRNAVMLEPDESGIGLYVSKKVIEMHHGTIKVDSKLGKGTVVSVTLPT